MILGAMKLWQYRGSSDKPTTVKLKAINEDCLICCDVEPGQIGNSCYLLKLRPIDLMSAPRSYWVKSQTTNAKYIVHCSKNQNYNINKD